jgi:hypothetical protein
MRRQAGTRQLATEHNPLPKRVSQGMSATICTNNPRLSRLVHSHQTLSLPSGSELRGRQLHVDCCCIVRRPAAAAIRVRQTQYEADGRLSIMSKASETREAFCSLLFGSRLSVCLRRSLFTGSGVPWLYRRLGRVRRLIEGQ